jgi:hypothetical protein
LNIILAKLGYAALQEKQKSGRPKKNLFSVSQGLKSFVREGIIT